MNCRKIIFTLVFIVPFLCSFSQNSPIDFDWQDERPRISLSDQEKKLPAIILTERITYKYVYENNELTLYSLEHRIVHVNSDDAIQTFNKIFISMYDVIELVDVKARTIDTEEDQILMDKENIKELKDEAESRAYKIFAMEGVKKGSEIEYYVIKKMNPRLTGSEYFQYSTHIKKGIFELIAPINFEFKFKSYNGLPEIRDSLVNRENYHYLVVHNVKSLEKEDYALYNPNRMRIEFKLSANLEHGTKEINTWSEVGENVFLRAYTRDRSEEKDLSKLYKKLKISSGASTEEKISTIENFIKTNYLIQDGFQKELSDISFIIDNKYGDRFGIVRLYTALFDLAEVKHQVVLTSMRDNMKFDGDFETYRYLNHYLFYFDDTNEFLSPASIEMRYPMIPAMLTYTDALFIKPVRIGDYESSINEIKFIPAPSYKESFNNLEIDIAFTEQMDKLEIRILKSLGGYDAMFIHSIYELLKEEDRDSYMETVMKSYASDADFSKLEVKNTNRSIPPTEKPVIIETELTSAALFEQAGNKILLKLGDVIGPQVEMYQDKERKLPVENDYNRMYDRVIRFQIPEGYTIKNPDDINIDLFYKKEKERIFNFTSTYEINDQLLTVKIMEYYKEIECPVEHFEEYRKVINAAADFNKVTLVLEPDNTK